MHHVMSHTAVRSTRLVARVSSRLIAAGVLVLAAAQPARAQHGNGYRFQAPEARITIRGGYDVASAGSDVFSFATDNLTLKKSDFSSLTGGAELAIPLSGRWDLTLDASYSRANKGSEFRHFIDNNNAPIQQTTTFERVPVMLNLRYNLMPTGRSIGRLAWIPSSFVPYVGAGGGAMWYRYHQEGDFIDFSDNSVFHGQLESNNWAAAAQGFGGVDINLTTMLALNADARYIWAKSGLSTDFSGFNRIDLSGVSATLGLTFRL